MAIITTLPVRPSGPERGRRPGIPTRTAIEKRIARFEGRLSPNRRRLLQATLENPDETYFLSSRALARRYRVDPATIVRTVQALGYERYTDFAADLREHFVSRLTPYRILKATTDEKRSLADHVRHSLERDLGNLNRLQSGLDSERVASFARRIHQARRILVVGSDLAASLASFFAYALLPLGFDAEAPVGTGGNLQHKVRLLARKDLLVAISFGRCLRVTVEAAKLARSRRRSDGRHHGQRHHAPGPRMRRLLRGLDRGGDVQRLLRGSHGAPERHRPGLRGDRSEPRPRAPAPDGEGVPLGSALVRGSARARRGQAEPRTRRAEEEVMRPRALSDPVAEQVPVVQEPHEGDRRHDSRGVEAGARRASSTTPARPARPGTRRAR